MKKQNSDVLATQTKKPVAKNHV